jgi:hypothetical protein
MAEAIWEIKIEDEETDQTTTREDNEGQIRQMRAAAETTWTWAMADHHNREQGGR